VSAATPATGVPRSSASLAPHAFLAFLASLASLASLVKENSA
jgi:hypothetical protein